MRGRARLADGDHPALCESQPVFIDGPRDLLAHHERGGAIAAEGIAAAGAMTGALEIDRAAFHP